MDIAPDQKKCLESKSERFKDIVQVTLPIRTVSEGNSTQHWRIKDKRHKRQQSAVAKMLKPLRNKLRLPCEIHLTRYAPRKLDTFDNLPMSMKWIADAVCAIITGDYRPGRADGDARIKITCDQIISKEYAVNILITM